MPKCKICREQTSLRYGLTYACGPDHAYEASLKAKAKSEARKKADERKEHRQAKEKIKSRSQWMAEAQATFNKYIRIRDVLLPCVCCGNFGSDEAWKPGGAFDCGHFLSVGSHPELRFDEDNCHKQLKSCNAGAGKYGNFHSKERTVSQAYRVRLIEKIGLERVLRLEGPHDPKKYTIDDLKAIKNEYAAKTRELLKQQDSLK